MAKVAQDPQLSSRIDHYLDYLANTWESVPLDAREWDNWDELSQLAYVIDWGVPEDRLHQLRQFAEQSLLTEAQYARFRALLDLVARHRPTLQRMLQDETG